MSEGGVNLRTGNMWHLDFAHLGARLLGYSPTARPLDTDTVLPVSSRPVRAPSGTDMNARGAPTRLTETFCLATNSLLRCFDSFSRPRHGALIGVGSLVGSFSRADLVQAVSWTPAGASKAHWADSRR